MLVNITLSLSDETIDSSINMSETTNNDIVDDFQDIFNPLEIRIIYFLIWIIYMTLSNVFFVILILYEKYGEDIMKRSINNRLWSQLGLLIILHNCVCSTIFLLRFIFGPLYFGLALFETFIINFYISWVYLALAEISVMKALWIYKFSWIAGIDENFAGRFLLKFNLGYSVIFHTARFVHSFSYDSSFSYLFFVNVTISFLFNYRFFIGSFFYTVHFQVLSGIKITQRPRLYGQISSIIFLVSVIALVITNIKKMKERYKERRFHQNIIVNLNVQQQHNEGQLRLNNVKNNFPLLSGLQITLLVGVVLTCHVTFWFLHYTFNDSKYYYKQYYILRELALFIYNIAMPLSFLIKNENLVYH